MVLGYLSVLYSTPITSDSLAISVTIREDSTYDHSSELFLHQFLESNLELVNDSLSSRRHPLVETNKCTRKGINLVYKPPCLVFDELSFSRTLQLVQKGIPSPLFWRYDV
jgi:hypothetical protein